MSHKFLSEEWFAEYDKAKAGVEVPDALKTMVANLDVQLENGELVKARIENGLVEKGQVDNPDATITAPQDIIYKALVLGDIQTAMPAVFNGQLKIDGDKAALIKMGMTPPTESQKALTEKLKEITAD